MKTDNHPTSPAETIAKSIVELVERTDGPVTLIRIAREIPGFDKKGSAWAYKVEHPDGARLIWAGMTRAGVSALQDVMLGRRVAVQFVNPLPYIQEHFFSEDKNWVPVVLLPKSVGNLHSPNWLLRTSRGFEEYARGSGADNGKNGFQPIVPRSATFATDKFAVA